MKMKLKLEKSRIALIMGIIALVFYLTLLVVSGFFMSRAMRNYQSDTQVDETLTKLKSSNSDDKTEEILTDFKMTALGNTVKVIFWTWCLIIYSITLVSYIIYALGCWQRNLPLARIWQSAIYTISILNFVPFSYLFLFAHTEVKEEKLAYFIMIALIFVFRIGDWVALFFMIKELKALNALLALEVDVEEAPAAIAVDSQDPPPSPPSHNSPKNTNKVSPAPTGGSNEEILH